VLQERMAQFVKLCHFALVLNNKLIGEDQQAFQVELEAGYESLKAQLAPLLSSQSL